MTPQFFKNPINPMVKHAGMAVGETKSVIQTNLETFGLLMLLFSILVTCNANIAHD